MDVDEALIERLAQSIHGFYRANHNPESPSWTELSEDLREANRAQARDIVGKLATIGARVEAGSSAERFSFTAVELERLAMAEHERWLSQRRHAGWRYAEARDDERRLHPMMQPWAMLSEEERDKDRTAVRHIPDVIASVGLRVVRG
jgi:hypothetical protein